MSNKIDTLDYDQMQGWKRTGFIILSTIGFIGYMGISLVFLGIALFFWMFFFLLGAKDRFYNNRNESSRQGFAGSMIDSIFRLILFVGNRIMRLIVKLLGLGKLEKGTDLPIAIVRSWIPRTRPNNTCFFLSVPTILWIIMSMIKGCLYGIVCT